MQFSAIIVTLMASMALASPAIDVRGGGGGGKTVTITTTGAGGKTVTVTTTTTTSSVSTATGSTGSGGSYSPCTSTLYSNAVCCSDDVLGVADLNCATVSKTPTSAADFKATCATSGQTAMCCVLPVLGQAVLCEKPVGL